MKKKIDKKIVIIVILVIVMVVLSVLYFNPSIITSIEAKLSNSSSTTESEKTVETTAETRTIFNTITKTGEIKATLEENLELRTNYYLSEVYVEKNQYIEAGTNILKYTNGTYLTAPYNCVITDISVPNIGSICTSKHYITVKGTDTLQTTVNVNEDELNTVYVGQEAQVTVTALDNKVYTAYVTSVSNTATYSGSSSKFDVIIQFQNDGSTLIGMTGKTEVILEKAENVIAIPKESITTSGGVSTITIINENGKTETATIETGISNDAYTEIKSGLSAGQKVQYTESTSSNAITGTTNGMQGTQGFDRTSMSRPGFDQGQMPAQTAPNK